MKGNTKREKHMAMGRETQTMVKKKTAIGEVGDPQWNGPLPPLRQLFGIVSVQDLTTHHSD